MIQYINLPPIPQDIIDQLPKCIDEYEGKVDYGVYVWTDSFTHKISQWCKENICNEIHWGFQIIKGDLPIHKDIITKTKFAYILQTGGPNVTTNFYQEDQTTVINSYIIQPQQWHIIEADCYHDVQGVNSTEYRMSVTGRIFPK